MASRLEPSAKPRPQVLLVHDFCSSPAELKPLGQILSKRGFCCTAPLLPGHGEGPGSMRVCTQEDWTEALIESFHALQKRGNPIVLIGAGLGANLCVGLGAQLFPRALVSLGPILHRSSFPKMGRGSGRRKMVSTESYLQGGSRDAVSKWRTEYGHTEVPPAFIELAQQVRSDTESAAKNISIPQLWVRSEHPSSSSQVVWQHLKQNISPVNVLSLDSPSRVVWLAPGRLQLFQRIASFLESLDRANLEDGPVRG